MRLIFLVLVTAALVGCGSEEGGTDAALADEKSDKPAAESPTTDKAPTETGSTAAVESTPQHHSMAVADVAALPACAPPAEGWLVYVKADAKFKTCSAGAWADIEIKGDKGDAGAKGDKGDAGAAGAAGQNGTDNRIVETFHCSGTIENDTFSVFYDFVRMSSGDVFVSGSVADAEASSSRTNYYAASQNGAASGSVVLTRDAAGTPGFGWWELRRTNNTVDVTYHDVELGGSGVRAWIISGANCVKATY